jgi:hypothetical protein
VAILFLKMDKPKMRRFFIAFFICLSFLKASSQLNLYYGNLHSHTDYTGGLADPITAFNYARNVAQINFLAVTDHNEGLNDTEWDSTLLMANRANLPGGFVALTGYEWTSPGYNHVNVFNTQSRVSRFNITDWNVFVQEVIGFGTAFCQFNHPGMIASNNWDNFAYLNAETDSVFRLIEVKSFSDDQYYIMALDNGWHVSATNNQDNHSADWGNASDSLTGIWAESLTPDDMINAMRSRRTFSTMDKNTSLWMDVNGNSMGSVITSSSTLNVNLKLSDSDGEIWNKIEIVGETGIVLNTITNHSSSVDTIITLTEQTSKYLFIRAMQNDNDYIWSAPVFVNYDNSSISDGDIQSFNFKVCPNAILDEFFVSFSLLIPTEIKIDLIELTGKKIRQIASGKYSEGNYKIDCDSEGLKSGFYFMHIESEKYSITRKIIVI